MARPKKQLDLRAVAAVLTDPGPQPATMERIARDLRVAKPTLYRMAASREELIRACVDAEAERLLEQVHGGFPATEPPLGAALRAVSRFAEDSPAGFALLFGGRHPEARVAVRRVENRLRDMLRRAARADGHELPYPDLVAAGLLSTAAGVVRRALEDGATWDSDRLSAALAPPHTEA